MRGKGYFSIAMMMAIVMILAAACGQKPQLEFDGTDGQNYSSPNNPIVTIQMKDEEGIFENDGKIVIELYPEAAPNTVANFISLAQQGFYDGVTFHRVIEGFMIQGGDPTGSGFGGPGYSIKGEFAANGFEQNKLLHTRGVISMARAKSYDSAGSQFFIMVGDAPHLDGEYAAFGKVIEGMDVADAIVVSRNDGRDVPYEDKVIEKVTVDTKGVTYGEPEKVEDHFQK